MKKYIILLIFCVFVAFLTSSCMATLSPDSSYGTDATYRNDNYRGHNHNRGRYSRDRDARRDRDRDEHSTLIIRN